MKAEALRKGLWLKGLDRKSAVAWLAAELGKGWYYQVDVMDARGLIRRCCTLSEQHSGGVLDGTVVRSNVLTSRFLMEMDEAGWPDLKKSKENEHKSIKNWLKGARETYQVIR